MNLGKLTKKLKKELVSKPKHTAALALALAVAVWFWAPLLVGKKKPAKAPAAEVAVAGSATPASAVATSAQVGPTWKVVRQTRQADPLASPVAHDLPHDPFRPLEPRALVNEDVEPNHDERETEHATIDPEKLGLTVESIAYMPTRRRAQINGITVRENDEVAIGAAKQDDDGLAARTAPQTGRVTAIRMREVDIEINGTTHTLQLRKKSLARGEKFTTAARRP